MSSDVGDRLRLAASVNDTATATGGGARVDSADRDGWTAAHSAAYWNHVELLKQIVNVANIDLTLKTSDGFSALDLAQYKENKECVDILLKASKRAIDVEDVDEWKPSHANTASSSAPMTRKRRKPTSETALPKLTSIKILLPAAASTVRSQSSNQATALRSAAERGDAAELARIYRTTTPPLLDADDDGNTALILAAMHGHVRCVEHLLQLHALPPPTVNHRNVLGRTALFAAASSGHTGCLDVLLRRGGADPNVADLDNCSPLLAAISEGRSECAELLLTGDRKLAFDEASTQDGITPLMAAIVRDQPAIVERLLDLGADVNKANSDGATPVIAAIAVTKKPAFIKRLVQKGGDLQKGTHDGMMPLEWAVRSSGGLTDTVQILLALGADRKHRNTAGQTAYDVAVELALDDCASLLHQRPCSPQQPWTPLAPDSSAEEDRPVAAPSVVDQEGPAEKPPSGVVGSPARKTETPARKTETPAKKAAPTKKAAARSAATVPETAVAKNDDDDDDRPKIIEPPPAKRRRLEKDVYLVEGGSTTVRGIYSRPSDHDATFAELRAHIARRPDLMSRLHANKLGQFTFSIEQAGVSVDIEPIHEQRLLVGTDVVWIH